jgi:hypothetical protein
MTNLLIPRYKGSYAPVREGDRVVLYDVQKKEICKGTVVGVSEPNQVYVDRDDIEMGMWTSVEFISKVKNEE